MPSSSPEVVPLIVGGSSGGVNVRSIVAATADPLPPIDIPQEEEEDDDDDDEEDDEKGLNPEPIPIPSRARLL